jgi:hypothetical protein
LKIREQVVGFKLIALSTLILIKLREAFFPQLPNWLFLSTTVMIANAHPDIVGPDLTEGVSSGNFPLQGGSFIVALRILLIYYQPIH